MHCFFFILFDHPSFSPPSSYSLYPILLTQADLLPRVGRQQEDQQGHGGQEHTRDEEIQRIKQGPPSQSHDKGDVRVGLGTAVVKDFMATTRNFWRRGKKPLQQRNLNAESIMARNIGGLHNFFFKLNQMKWSWAYRIRIIKMFYN